MCAWEEVSLRAFLFVGSHLVIWKPSCHSPELLGSFLSFYFFSIYYFWLPWVFVAMCGLSLVVASGGYSLDAGHRLLTAMASLVAERGLGGMGFSSCGKPA